MGEVVNWRGITTLPLDPERVIDAAKGKLERVVIIGRTVDGEEYFASSEADGGTVMWDLERAKLRLLRTADDD